MYLAKIFITRRRSILDPQGKAVELGIKSLEIDKISDVRVDKYIELKINEADQDSAKSKIEKICNDLLANPHLEDYTYKLIKE
ncbi:MAG: phosphoribosylformylglycinamidine synthase subunit PurS [Bacteroidetes bacterium]|nr:phosphoribosylformylglycinamidine synthase subunit PurS [Bacteroidota bacterium]MBU2585490.1 phosphoribosylformylglycinamidine synthase subunit PurS [Bacteroidota bacterium]